MDFSPAVRIGGQRPAKGAQRPAPFQADGQPRQRRKALQRSVYFWAGSDKYFSSLNSIFTLFLVDSIHLSSRARRNLSVNSC